jgi:hypothetical protein
VIIKIFRLLFESGSLFVAQAGIKLVFLVLQISECWHYRWHVPPHILFFKALYIKLYIKLGALYMLGKCANSKLHPKLRMLWGT